MFNLAPRRGIKHLAQGIALSGKAANGARPVRATAFLAALCAMLLTACLSEVDAPRGSQGTFSLDLATDSLTAEVVTRAPRQLNDAEAATFLVTLTDGEGEEVWTQRIFSSITLADRTQPLGTGYIVTAENITTVAAEALNEGWGARRYAGTSQPFAVVASQTTHVTVPCSMANAGLCVTFDNSFTSFFSDFAVTTSDARNLLFNAANAETAIAYYNTDAATATIDVPILITASAGWDGTVRLSRILTLQAGKITRLAVKLNAPEPSEGNISIVAITYDDTFDEGTTQEIELN